jgi:hypothetical protein
MADYNLEGVIRLKDETSEAVDTAGQSVGKFEGALKAAKAALTAFGVIEAAKAVNELGKLGAQAERTERGFTTISGGASQAQANLDAMISATNGAIDRTTAMGLANQMMQMGLANNADELARNAEMATRLGAAMGTDAITAMENWNAMLANQSLPRLDTYGISSGKVRTRINELMAATQDLTREQAFNIAVMEEGQKAMERLGPAVEDNAMAVEQAAAAWSNLKVEIGKRFANTVAGSHSVIGKFTRLWGDNLRIMNESNGEIGVLQANYEMLFEVIGAKNTVFDQYRQAQEDATEAAQFGATMAEGYAQRAEMAGKQTFYFTGELEDSQAAFDTYQAAIDGATKANEDYYWAQKMANQAAAEAESAFLSAAAALGEMSVASLVESQLRALEAAEEAGTLSTEELTEAKRELLVQFGLLTPAEEEAQSKIDALTQSLIDGKIGPYEFAAELRNVKRDMDALQDKEVTLTLRKVTYETKITQHNQSEAAQEYHWASGFQGWITEPTPVMIGEGGVPEYVSVTPGNQIQNTTNINVSMPQATNVGPAIAALQALYGAN